jgi:anti-anti-sigma regulatory factor
MLRITTIGNDPSTTIVRIEGKLLEPWLEEVRRACVELVAPQRPVCLDLGAVTFVDAAGVDLLHELFQRGVTLAACSAFVAALLKRERSP